jgi:FkbM family methyltransferase
LKNKLSKRLGRWALRASPDKFLRRYNIIKKLHPSFRVSIDFDPQTGLFSVKDGIEHVFVARVPRLSWQWYGIENRKKVLQTEYLLPVDLIKVGDLVVDCGANIGEFSLICNDYGAHVLAFEPDPIEFKALGANIQDRAHIETFNVALWNETKELSFFDANDSGDSSLIDPGSARSVIQVQASRFDDVDLGALSDARIRLFKLEAEGAEPEILEGLQATLPRIDYIVVDMGPERGLSKTATVVEVTDFLYSHGFQLVDFFPRRCTGLFRSKSAVR